MAKIRQFRLLIGFVLILIIIIMIATSLGNSAKDSGPAEVTFTEGISYLQSLESKDATTVEDKLKALRQAEIQKLRDERMAQLASGEVSVWSLFEDYVLMGDSRVMGFDFYDRLEDDRVMADKGDTILTLQEHIPEIVAANPSYLFISYGVNDVGSGMWASTEEYVADFTAIIQQIRKDLPDVKIFVNSILLAYEPAFYTSAAWYDIPEYNTALENMCRDTGCYYVDNTSTCEAYAALYEGDGIHVSSSFYPYWAANMIMEVYDSELEQSEDPAA